VQQKRYLTAQEAASELNITLSTLYAYVSRGLIRSEATSGRTRSRLYHAEDVNRLKTRKHYRRNPDKVAEQVLQAGAPVLESAITLITDNCLYYRGQDALALATSQPVEVVAALIWTGELKPDQLAPAMLAAEVLSPRSQAVLPHLKDLKPIERFQAILPLAAADDLAAYDLGPAAVGQTGRRILELMTTIATMDNRAATTSTSPGPGDQATVARRLQQAWVPDDRQAQRLLNAALILCADHELNASAFTARCAASTGATPYAVVMAGLAALQGFKHGTASEQVEAFFREVESAPSVRQAVIDRLKRGEQIPGYGHVIYRGVDPRARVLQQLLMETYPHAPAVTLAKMIIQAAKDLTHHQHNVDFMLATLARTLSLPPGGGPALFALGRTIGWIGHAIEQYQLDQIIRPRARYVGERPSSAAP